ncbi:Late embryoproteinsis abundant protein D-34 [Hibiscus syriacus]|uniref:Late embryoproteinsis abundant protein D-34 n=1 Tax=Hibiscus syriacus TaxID=106335 RepID=A0A6A2ZKH2_HIBSY|nr:late embryogenesis abundant protein D-34-like [Hibiscus syriacus]KAE8692076.1 Late embryoproteinsis abundant protein D-34 [Hibiscus syriacus]
MSQQQPQRAGADQSHDQLEPITFGNGFNVTGELASKPIGPQDAAAMQSAENMVLGQTTKKGPAAAMQSASTANERAGLVSRNQGGDQGVAVIKSNKDGEVLVTESVGGQVVAEYRQPDVSMVTTTPATLIDPGPITIGEALEVAALSASDKPIDESDAAAIQAAEMIATGSSEILPGGIASEAQSAAIRNSQMDGSEDRATLSDILADASAILVKDKVVTREDAEKVVAAEVRNNPEMQTTAGGVGDAMAIAARRNQNSTI